MQHGTHQPVLVSRDIGIRGGCVGPHDVTPDHPARAGVAEGEDGDVTPDVLRARRRPHHHEAESEDDDRSGGVIVHNGEGEDVRAQDGLRDIMGGRRIRRGSQYRG